MCDGNNVWAGSKTSVEEKYMDMSCSTYEGSRYGWSMQHAWFKVNTMCLYVCVYICVCVCVYIYIYIYSKNEVKKILIQNSAT